MGQKKKRRLTRPSRKEIRKFTKLLGPDIAKRYTGSQLVVLYRDMHIATKLLIDLWIAKKEKMSDSSEGSDGSSHTES